MLKTALALGSIAIAGGVGGLIWMNSECSEGTIVRNAWQCVRNAGFETAFCNSVFSADEEALRRLPAVYASEAQCRAAHPNCAESKRPVGWSPRPHSYCVITGSDGRVSNVVRLSS